MAARAGRYRRDRENSSRNEDARFARARNRNPGCGLPGRQHSRQTKGPHKDMSDPLVAVVMLLILILAIFLGFPVAFTLMALGVAFGYYAYFDGARMWMPYTRAVES